MVHLKSQRIEADEAWGFVYAKPENVPEHLSYDHSVGEVWTWVSYDPVAKLVVNWHVGGHEYSDAITFMLDLARRIPGRLQLTTDQLALYRPAVEEAFGNRVDYATIRKIMHEPTKSPDLKFQQPRLRENRVASVWLLEAVRDAQDNKQNLPTELLQELSRNLFSSGTSPDADLHPQAMTEMLTQGLKSISVRSSDGSKVKASRK